jgi:multicomponent K+:H+ antiporter subunit E
MKPRRYLPRPWLSLSLLAVWLLLNQSLAPGHWLLGTLLGWWLPLLLQRLAPVPARRVRKPFKLLRLMGVLLWDILLANLVVARQVLLQRSQLQPGFVYVPLERDDELVAVLLASMITLTPGTVGVRVELAQRRVLVHALHLTDADALVNEVKSRYESQLLEILPC